MSLKIVSYVSLISSVMNIHNDNRSSKNINDCDMIQPGLSK